MTSTNHGYSRGQTIYLRNNKLFGLHVRIQLLETRQKTKYAEVLSAQKIKWRDMFTYRDKVLKFDLARYSLGFEWNYWVCGYVSDKVLGEGITWLAASWFLELRWTVNRDANELLRVTKRRFPIVKFRSCYLSWFLSWQALEIELVYTSSSLHAQRGGLLVLSAIVWSLVG